MEDVISNLGNLEEKHMQLTQKNGRLFGVVYRLEKPDNLTPFRQLNLTTGSRDRLTPSFLTKTVKNFS